MEKGVATIIGHASDAFEHIVLCLTTSGETARLLPAATKIIELHKKPGNSPGFYFELAKNIRKQNPSLVHTRNWGGTDGIIAARMAGCKRVVHGEHGWDLGDSHGQNMRRVFLRRFFSTWVKEYICVSRDMEIWLKEKIKVKRPLSQIYNGIDTRTFAPDGSKNRNRSKFGLAEKDIVIGVVGRLDPIKNHAVLFKSFEQLNIENPDAKLLVVGDGPERKSLERLAGSGVHFWGNRTDVPDILRTMDIFTLPSINEGISNTILEAMATGLPVVATNVGGNSEIIDDGKTGQLVPSDDAAALAAALSVYINSPELRASHGSQGRVRAKKLFSVDKMVSEYESVYRRVADLGRWEGGRVRRLKD